MGIDVGAGSGALAGAVAGSALGGPVGALAGMVIGASGRSTATSDAPENDLCPWGLALFNARARRQRSDSAAPEQRD